MSFVCLTALIEGLVGSSSEISNVFEIEDEINQDWSESDTDTDGFDSADDIEEGGGEEIKSTSTSDDQPLLLPGTVSPTEMSPTDEQGPAVSTDPPTVAPTGNETPRRVAFPPTVPKSPSSMGIPSPRKRMDSLDGLNRAKPSPLAQIYSNKLSSSHQPHGLSSSSSNVSRGASFHRRSASTSAHEGTAHRRAFSQSTVMSGPVRPPSTIHEGRVAFARDPSPVARSATQASNLTQQMAVSAPLSATLGQVGGFVATGQDTIGKASDVLETGDMGIVESKMDGRVKEMEERMGKMTDLLERILDRLPPPVDSRRNSSMIRGGGTDSGDGES